MNPDLATNIKVVGSSPSVGKIFFILYFFAFHAKIKHDIHPR